MPHCILESAPSAMRLVSSFLATLKKVCPTSKCCHKKSLSKFGLYIFYIKFNHCFSNCHTLSYFTDVIPFLFPEHALHQKAAPCARAFALDMLYQYLPLSVTHLNFQSSIFIFKHPILYLCILFCTQL